MEASCEAEILELELKKPAENEKPETEMSDVISCHLVTVSDEPVSFSGPADTSNFPAPTEIAAGVDFSDETGLIPPAGKSHKSIVLK